MGVGCVWCSAEAHPFVAFGKLDREKRHQCMYVVIPAELIK